MKKTMLSAVQKVKMAMGKKLPKLSKPSLNAGFEKLPESVQKKMMKGKKPKMATNKKEVGTPEGRARGRAIIAKVKKEGEAKVSAAGNYNTRGKKPEMVMTKKKPKMAMRKKK